ncbi:hypothetical protein A2U01_0063406, partial [Trifolium medium]|nr:hypothetical protein [Trifolium medium]
MVHPAPTVDLYKPKKRKSSTKEGKKEVKKEAKKESKKGVQKEVKPEPKEVKKDVSKKRKSEGVVVDETDSRTKRKHEKTTEGDNLETDSDDGKTLAQRLKLRT